MNSAFFFDNSSVFCLNDNDNGIKSVETAD